MSDSTYFNGLVTTNLEGARRAIEAVYRTTVCTGPSEGLLCMCVSGDVYVIQKFDGEFIGPVHLECSHSEWNRAQDGIEFGQRHYLYFEALAFAFLPDRFKQLLKKSTLSELSVRIEQSQSGDVSYIVNWVLFSYQVKQTPHKLYVLFGTNNLPNEVRTTQP